MKANNSMQDLLTKYKEISLLNKINALLGWDMNVNLPTSATEGRASQAAYIAKLISSKWLEKDFKDAVETLDQKKLSEEEKAMLRNLKHAGVFYFNVPQDVIVEFSETTSKAFMAWQEAKQKNDFLTFEPHLKKLVKLNQIIADHMGYKDDVYDALLNIFEPGLTSKNLKALFGELRPALTSLLKKIQKSSKYTEQSELVGEARNYPVDDQKQLATFILRKINYDLSAGRMDTSTHPFTDTLGARDIRITNRYKSTDFVESIMVALHEGGHALYEQGIDEKYSETPLEGGVSLGIHESQSRFWENQVGRSESFTKFLLPVLQAFYPQELSQYGVETIYRTLNHVHPSFIRTEADEVTYNLHIALRFELEHELINNKVKVVDLPEIWRARMKKYLGVVPQKDSEGVLQDVHWSHGLMGYFPTYTLGNLYAAQFTHAMKKELEIDELIEKGEFGTILSWLRTNIHQHGALLWPDALVKGVTGEELDSKYFLSYLKEKYLSLYY